VQLLNPAFAQAATGAIIRLDPRSDELVPKNAVIEKVADGFAWVEGPAWEQTRRLLAVHRYSE
jgi:gluconolactonase